MENEGKPKKETLWPWSKCVWVWQNYPGTSFNANILYIQHICLPITPTARTGARQKN